MLETYVQPALKLFGTALRLRTTLAAPGVTSTGRSHLERLMDKPFRDPGNFSVKSRLTD
jgi:hypothetical protein